MSDRDYSRMMGKNRWVRKYQAIWFSCTTGDLRSEWLDVDRKVCLDG